MHKSFALAVLAATLTAFVAHAERAADAGNGEQLARRWCGSCHLLSASSRPLTEAVPFSEIAKDPNFDEARLAFFLLDPHPTMPNMSLTRSEAADLAAFIIRQK
jgi:mono/diheme cytochrome c family protein